MTLARTPYARISPADIGQVDRELKKIEQMTAGLYVPKVLVAARSPYAVLATDTMLLCDCTAGAITLTFPLAARVDGMSVQVVKSDTSANAVTLSGTFSGVVNPTITVAHAGFTVMAMNGVYHVTAIVTYPILPSEPVVTAIVYQYYDPRRYGATVNGTTDDSIACQRAIAAGLSAGNNKGTRCPFAPGQYKITSNPFLGLFSVNVPVEVDLDGAELLTTKQIRIPASAVVRGSNRLRDGITADPSFIASVGITSAVRASNVVTVTTSSVHGLETGAVVRLDFSAVISTVSLTANVVTVTTATAHHLSTSDSAAITDVSNPIFNGVFTVTVTSSTTFTYALTASDTTSTAGTVRNSLDSGVFNASSAMEGGWPVTVTSATTFTFAQTAANRTVSFGIVYIPLVVLAGTEASSGTRLENCTVDAGSLTNSVGVYSNFLSELSGGEQVNITGAYRRGLWIERSGYSAVHGGPNNYAFENMEVSVVPNVGAVGVEITGTYGLHRGINHITINTQTNAGTMDCALLINGAPGLYSRIHVEHTTDGVRIGGRGLASQHASSFDSASITLANVTSDPSCTSLVRLKNAGEVHDIVLLGMVRSGATNILVDEVAGVTLTDDYLANYVMGGIPTNTRTSSNSNVPWSIQALATFASGIVLGANALAATVEMQLKAAAGQIRQISFFTGSLARWIWRVDATAEGGSDDGSNISLLARHDDGSSIDSPFFMWRRAGREIQVGRPLQLLKSFQKSFVTPAQITADQNDYQPGVACVARISSDAARNITGLLVPDAVSGATNSGVDITLVNVGAFGITLKNQSTSSSGVNRIITGTGADLVLAADQAATLTYDGTTARWRVVSHN